MLPVTCALTRWRATAAHEVQICDTAALNCMTLPYDLIKRRRPLCTAVSSVTYALVDIFGFLCDLQALPQPPRGCEEAHKRGRRAAVESVGGVGGPYRFTRPAVARDYGGVLTQKL